MEEGAVGGAKEIERDCHKCKIHSYIVAVCVCVCVSFCRQLKEWMDRLGTHKYLFI